MRPPAQLEAGVADRHWRWRSIQEDAAGMGSVCEAASATGYQVLKKSLQWSQAPLTESDSDEGLKSTGTRADSHPSRTHTLDEYLEGQFSDPLATQFVEGPRVGQRGHPARGKPRISGLATRLISSSTKLSLPCLRRTRDAPFTRGNPVSMSSQCILGSSANRSRACFGPCTPKKKMKEKNYYARSHTSMDITCPNPSPSPSLFFLPSKKNHKID